MWFFKRRRKRALLATYQRMYVNELCLYNSNSARWARWMNRIITEYLEAQKNGDDERAEHLRQRGLNAAGHYLEEPIVREIPNVGMLKTKIKELIEELGD